MDMQNKNFDNIELNPEQKEAVFHPGGPLIVYAGAGTGKTRVITCRIAHLILERNVHPSRILAITFTNKAAFEMKRRVVEMIASRRDVNNNERNYDGGINFGFPLWISTFHSFCAKILKIDSESFGVAKDFAIYDEDDQKRILKEILKEIGFDKNDKVYRPGSIAEKINRLKDSLMDAETYALSVGSSTNADDRILSDIYLRYDKKLQLHNALDFGDLILKVVKRFNHDKALLEKYQKKFDHILVDEYQDTNIAQYHLVKYLSALPPQNLCVVGDDDQSIYSWRGADRRNIINFQVDYPNAKIVKLERNYRSTPQILRAGVGVISNNIERYPKTLQPTLPDGENISWQEFSSDLEEAQAVVFNIKKIIEDENIHPSKIAVLYRMNAQSRVLEDAFISSGIPYRLVGSVRFYERHEVKNIIAYLRVIRNPSDEISLKRIINVPARGVGDATLEKLSSLAQANKKIIFDVIADENLLTNSNIGAKTLKHLLSLADKIKKWRLYAAPSGGDSKKISLSELARMVAEESGYMDELRNENTPESISRIENIKELISAIAEYEEISEEPSIGGWLDEFALMGEGDKAEGSTDGVVLTTIHLAKGLEFEVVFIVGLEESIFPLASSWYNPQDMEEERRLCYVAITRAKKKLFMSSARFKMIYGKTSYLMPSRFVKEAMSSLMKSEENFVSKSININKDNKEPVSTIGNDISYAWREGLRVRHKLFGTGIVASVSSIDDNNDDVKLVVRFDNGHTRKFYAKYAGFEIL